MKKFAPRLIVAVVLAGLALVAVSGSLSGPSRWSPDGLFYQAKLYQLQGDGQATALERAFEGPLGADLRKIDPTRSGSPAWVSYNARFYERRLTVPVAAAAIEPLAGDRSILDISLAGYVATIVALFFVLLMRFRIPVAAAVTVATILLPALRHHATYPLTDSWGLALEIAALGAGMLVLERRPRWIILWVLAILTLSFTRDSAVIPLLAAAWLTVSQRSKVSLTLLGSGVAAALPAMVAVQVPLRELLAQMLNGIQPAPDASWGFVLGHYPGAIVDLLQADGGFVRNEAWYSAAYLIVGLIALFAFTRDRASNDGATFLKAAAVAGAAYILVVPVFSAFRLELVCVPMAAFGLAHALDRALAFLPVPVPATHAPAAVQRSGS